MRRLPIFFLIDVSESMVGEPIQAVEDGMAHIIKELKSDPYALETVYVSVIVFAGQPKTLVPLQDIISFYPPKFPIGGGTSFGSGLGHLMMELRRNIVKNTSEVKGDWKPIIFLFTDGVPTDETAGVIREWQTNWKRSANMVAVAFGRGTDLSVLKELTEDVLLFNNTTNQSYKRFFKWVTDSIKTSSMSVENNGTGFDLSKLPEESLAKLDQAQQLPVLPKEDNNYAVFTGKCSRSKRPYLIKYGREFGEEYVGGLPITTSEYRLMGAYPVDNGYFELSSEGYSARKISTEELRGFPTCPCCGNQYGFTMCSCGGLHCMGDETSGICPWCNQRGEYGIGSGHIDVNRGQG